jgi:hypothetical protein
MSGALMSKAAERGDVAELKRLMATGVAVDAIDDRHGIIICSALCTPGETASLQHRAPLMLCPCTVTTRSTYLSQVWLDGAANCGWRGPRVGGTGAGGGRR